MNGTDPGRLTFIAHNTIKLTNLGHANITNKILTAIMSVEEGHCKRLDEVRCSVYW